MPEALPTLSSPGGDPSGALLVVEAGLGADQQPPSCWNSLPSRLPALNENKVLVLDTDYKKYLLFCMDNSAEPEQSLACQCLGGCRPCPPGETSCVVLAATGGGWERGARSPGGGGGSPSPVRREWPLTGTWSPWACG